MKIILLCNFNLVDLLMGGSHKNCISSCIFKCKHFKSQLFLQHRKIIFISNFFAIILIFSSRSSLICAAHTMKNEFAISLKICFVALEMNAHWWISHCLFFSLHCLASNNNNLSPLFLHYSMKVECSANEI